MDVSAFYSFIAIIGPLYNIQFRQLRFEYYI